MSNKLDRLVATRVMGWTLTDRVKCGWGPGPDVYATGNEANPTHQSFQPSSDIYEAWEVVRNLRSRKWDVTLKGTGQKWLCFVEDWKARVDISVSNDTDTLAICLAALRAVGVPEAEITEAMQ